MIITRKALVGFILLGLIVFFTTQYTVSQIQQPLRGSQNANIKVLTPDQTRYPGPYAEPVLYKYQPPIISLGNNTPIVAMVIIELLTLGCYLILKKYEPAINEYAADIMNQFKQ